MATFRGPQPLIVDVAGTEGGVGTVLMDPPGITCVNPPGSTGSCSSMYRIGTEVTLTAASAPDSIFVGWTGGACAGSPLSPTCVVAITGTEVHYAMATFR